MQSLDHTDEMNQTKQDIVTRIDILKIWVVDFNLQNYKTRKTTQMRYP